ncbi:MAG: hypothetical protein ACTHU0_28735 [Kofleriaceae bacterium]
MDYDVIYLDEGRNASTDHRTGGRPASTPWRPLPSRPAGSRTVVVPPGSRPTVITGTASGYAQPAVYAQPTYLPPMSSIASRFGMTSGELIDTGIQLLAALFRLPAAPTAQGEAAVDIENLVTYQGALAQHAKRDEQLRTIGNLAVRILK